MVEHGRPRRRGPLSTPHFTLSRRPGAARACPDAAGAAGARVDPVLLMAVPKRLLKRAVDRNTLRRVAREAWRASIGARAQCGATPDASPPLLRLHRRPEGFESMTHRARKRLWRVEIDRLLALDRHA